MEKVRRLLREWGIPAGILVLWCMAVIYTVHALYGMEKAMLHFREPAGVHAPST